jgi:RNA polymerase sigma-70 factor (ECF subfamily)
MVMIQGESPGRRAATAFAPVDAEDDETLLTRLRAGDDVAFRTLVDRHRPWLVRLCTRLLGYDAHAGEDAAQETLVKLHAAVRRDGRVLHVRPWLSVVARNTCVDEWRRRRPDLPGELPEVSVAGDEPLPLDATLTDAWQRLSGRHREVLYLREVLGFSYKEIGAVMGLTMPATETLVFRARAALRREYERCGGSAFGCGLLGFRLARLGLGRRRKGPVADGLSNATVSDASFGGVNGFNGLSSRLAQWMSTSLPGYSEQAVAKVLSMTAGVVMAAASVIPAIAPFADRPGAATVIQASATASETGAGAVTGGGTAGSAATPTPAASFSPVSFKSMLGDAVPAGWTPGRGRNAAAGVAPPAAGDPPARPPTVTPLRDAAATARSGEKPALGETVRQPGTALPLGSTALPTAVDAPDRPAHPLRSVSTDPPPLPTEPTPVPAPAIPPPPPPVSRPSLRDTTEPVKPNAPARPHPVRPAADQRPTPPAILPR